MFQELRAIIHKNIFIHLKWSFQKWVLDNTNDLEEPFLVPKKNFCLIEGLHMC